MNRKAKEKHSCYSCRVNYEEPFIKGRLALRCKAPGWCRGRIVAIYPEEMRALAMSTLPAWCPLK